MAYFSDPFILFGLRQHISRVELNGSRIGNYITLEEGVGNIVGLDIDIR